MKPVTIVRATECPLKRRKKLFNRVSGKGATRLRDDLKKSLGCLSFCILPAVTAETPFLENQRPFFEQCLV